MTETGDCERDPLPEIPHCQVYSNYNRCIQCNQGFLLVSTSECQEVNEIELCTEYEPTASLTLCNACEEGYYVLANQCVARQNQVSNCQDYHPTRDQCQVCLEGFQVTNDKLKCLPAISNCSSYSQSTSLSTQLTCTTCDPTYYLSNNLCTLGEIVDCLQYSTPTTCSTCVNGFYPGVDSETGLNACLAHTPIDSCETYSQTTADLCTTCDNSHVWIYQ